MLVISRKKNESIVINNDITIIVVEIRGDKVRLAVDAPKEVPCHRREVYDAIRRNSEAEPAPTAREVAVHHGTAEETPQQSRAIENRAANPNQGEPSLQEEAAREQEPGTSCSTPANAARAPKNIVEPIKCSAPRPGVLPAGVGRVAAAIRDATTKLLTWVGLIAIGCVAVPFVAGLIPLVAAGAAIFVIWVVILDAFGHDTSPWPKIPAWSRAQAVRAIKSCGGIVGRGRHATGPWARRFIGDIFGEPTCSVSLSSAPISDFILVHLKILASVGTLTLEGTRITDLKMLNTSTLARLRPLGPGSATRVTGAGFAVAADGAREPQATLPDCVIRADTSPVRSRLQPIRDTGPRTAQAKKSRSTNKRKTPKKDDRVRRKKKGLTGQPSRTKTTKHKDVKVNQKKHAKGKQPKKERR